VYRLKFLAIALERLELTDDCGTGVIGAARLLGVEVPERSPSIGLVVLLRPPSAGEAMFRSGLFSIQICLRSGSGSGLASIRSSFGRLKPTGSVKGGRGRETMPVVNIQKHDDVNHNRCMRNSKEELTAIGNLTSSVI